MTTKRNQKDRRANLFLFSFLMGILNGLTRKRAMEAPPKVKCPLSPSTLCSHVDCRRCRYFKDTYKEQEVLWLCAFCTPKVAHKVLGFYGDGKCSYCDDYGIVLVGVIHADV